MHYLCFLCPGASLPPSLAPLRKSGVSLRLLFLRMYDWTKKLVFGPATEAPDVPDNTLYDGQVADAAVTALRELKENEKPFFLAVGFIKPHSPYIAPAAAPKPLLAHLDQATGDMTGPGHYVLVTGKGTSMYTRDGVSRPLTPSRQW